MPEIIPGSISLRAMATNFLENSSVNNGIRTETAGQNSGSVPDWKWTASASWSVEAWRASLTARGISSGVYNNYYIECTTGCPLSDTRNVTVSENDIKGAIYFDASVSRDVMFGESSKANFFLNVRNLLDKDPPVVGAFGSFADTLSAYNPSLYDGLGRVFSAGVRVEF
jgi:outer membrane receptor protein involved in Fe transport